MWVCDGIKLSVGRTFDPVVFLWLWIDTLYSSMFTSMQLVGYMKVISKQHQHPKIAQTVYPTQWEMEGCEVNNTTINGGAGGYNRLLRGHLTQSTSILCLRRMGNTQHNTHITIVGIICKYENRGYIIHIALRGTINGFFSVDAA